jgi:phasin
MASAPKKPTRPAIMLEQPTISPAEIEAFPTPVTEAPEPVSLAVAAIETVEAPKEVVEPPREAVKELGENVRAIVEKGLVDTRAKYAQAKTVAEETSAAIEASLGAARSGVVAFNVKALDAVKAGANAQFDFFKSLASAKSPSELVTLHAEFARSRFEEASARSKELAELARKVADETVAPIKAHVAKTFKVAV